MTGKATAFTPADCRRSTKDLNLRAIIVRGRKETKEDDVRGGKLWVRIPKSLQ